MVNSICGSMELIWLCFACWMTKVSSIYLSQSLGGIGAVLMALDSNLSMNMLATKGLVGEPIATPWTCS